jgi:exopolysaccharide production protein ExoQ
MWRLSWVAILGVTLMVVSEYKVGTGRSQQAAIGGQADSGTLAELLAYGVVGAFLLFQLSRAPRWRRWPASLMAMWGFTLAMALGATWSPFPMFALARAGQLVVVAWFATAIAQHATAGALSRFCHAYVVVVALSVALGVVVPGGHIQGQEGRFHWLYVHPNIAGAFLGIAVTVVVALLGRRSPGSLAAPWPLPAYLVLLAVTVGGLLATRSRGALTGAIVGSAVALLFSGHRGRWADRLLIVTCVTTIGWALAERGEPAAAEHPQLTDRGVGPGVGALPPPAPAGPRVHLRPRRLPRDVRPGRGPQRLRRGPGELRRLRHRVVGGVAHRGPGRRQPAAP